jgi:hypothetical protein
MKVEFGRWILLLAVGSALAAPPQPPPQNSPAPALSAPSAPQYVPPPSIPLQKTFPTGKPASPALSDPVGRQLNVALGLAGALRKEASEGRAGESRTTELLEALQKTLLGARERSVVQDRKPGDEVWTQPQAEAQALVDEAVRLRSEALKLPPAETEAKLRALQEATGLFGRAFDKLSEASRKRHETTQNSIRNIK